MVWWRTRFIPSSKANANGRGARRQQARTLDPFGTVAQDPRGGHVTWPSGRLGLPAVTTDSSNSFEPLRATNRHQLGRTVSERRLGEGHW